MSRARVVLAASLLATVCGLAESQLLNLQEGQSCKGRGGDSGVCTRLGNCRDPGDFRREQPPICSFKGGEKEPIICCSRNSLQRSSPGLRANQYCRSALETCGDRNLVWQTDTSAAGEMPVQLAVPLAPTMTQPSAPTMTQPSAPTMTPPLAQTTTLPSKGTTPHFNLTVTDVFAVMGGLPSKPKIHVFMNDADVARILPANQPIIYIFLNRRKRDDSVARTRDGELSEPKSKSYMALIGYGEEKKWSCGGSLISSKYVLSAAHCSSPEVLGPAKWVRLGDLDISSSNDDAKVQDIEIAERTTHPQYRQPQVYHDIALFRLAKEASFTPWVAPVCLHTQRTIPDSRLTVTGWGRVDFAGETSNHLLEADLDHYNDTECRRLLPTKDNKTPRGIDSKFMFCAGKSDGSKDACSGDSGGPLVLKAGDQCLKTQVGITSYGNMCGLPDSPGVYTRVSTYIGWIEDIVFRDL